MTARCVDVLICTPLEISSSSHIHSSSARARTLLITAALSAPVVRVLIPNLARFVLRAVCLLVCLMLLLWLAPECRSCARVLCERNLCFVLVCALSAAASSSIWFGNCRCVRVACSYVSYDEHLHFASLSGAAAPASFHGCDSLSVPASSALCILKHYLIDWRLPRCPLTEVVYLYACIMELSHRNYRQLEIVTMRKPDS